MNNITQLVDAAPPSTTFPYSILTIVSVWILLIAAYFISRWRQKAKQQYIIPRVFVLCSPRTVQYHYELILRIGLPSPDFNPDRHDIDITVQGTQRNEVVPLTRLNTKTLLDEPLITSLSIIVYRLVEMPPLGSLILKHCGPFRANVYAYDFTVIDLATNREQFYTINRYIGSLNRAYLLTEPSDSANVKYPIDDVPLPHRSLEDIFLILFMVVNCLMLSTALLPIDCSTILNISVVMMVTFNGLSVVVVMDWFLYYNLQWNQERREYFNQTDARCYGYENMFRIALGGIAIIIGVCAFFFTYFIEGLTQYLIWLLVTTNACILVIGLWNMSRLMYFGQKLVALGLRFRGIESITVGRHVDSGMTVPSKTGSASDEDGGGSAMSSTQNSQIARSIGPRSSVKSFGFDTTNMPGTNHSANSAGTFMTGATPNAQLSKTALMPIHAHKLLKQSASDYQPSRSNSSKPINAGLSGPRSQSSGSGRAQKKEGSSGRDRGQIREDEKSSSRGKTQKKLTNR